jgi:opacity protein-like surface antigen
MKSKIFVIMTAVVIISIYSTAMAKESADKYSVSFGGGLYNSPNVGMILSPKNGFDASDDLSDVVKTGSDLELKFGYRITDNWIVEGRYMYGWMYFKDGKKPVQSDDPAFVLQGVTVNGVYNLGPVFNPNVQLEPYVTLGVGMYPWKVTKDGMSGDAFSSPVDNSKDFSGVSFGWNTGMGLEYYVHENWSLGLGFRYHYVFMEDKDKFGSDFENQSFTNFNLGASYHFSVK